MIKSKAVTKLGYSQKGRIAFLIFLGFAVNFFREKDSLVLKDVWKGGTMDSQLLLELYKKQAKMIYFYLKKNGCSHQDAEDIVQESYMKYISYSSGVPSDKALSYIFTISMNEFKKILKKKGKEQIISVDDHRFWNNFANDQDTESSVLNIEMNHEIALTLERIQEVYKQLLLLKYELDLSYKEIALMLGMKEETVRTYLFRARKEFQKKWRYLHE